MLKKMGRTKATVFRAKSRCQNEMGMHARPAAEFARKANSFRSEIWILTPRGRFSAFELD